jgi:hypothetical protein
MGIKKDDESDKVTGDKFESLIDRAAGSSDRKRGQQPQDDDEREDEEVEDDEDAEIEDENEE